MAGAFADAHAPAEDVQWIDCGNAFGGTAVHQAWLSVASGLCKVAVVIGVEKLRDRDKARSFEEVIEIEWGVPQPSSRPLEVSQGCHTTAEIGEDSMGRGWTRSLIL